MAEKRGIILGHARSGSSELARAVEDVTGEKFRMEPFHKVMKKRGISFDSPSFPEYLDEVMSTGPRFIKHLWNGLTEEQNASVLAHPNIHGIVFLYRRDTVQAALSTVVARITKSWRVNAGPIPKPLPLGEIEERAQMYADGQASRWRQVEGSGFPRMSLAYEDLYSPDTEIRKALLLEVCTILGLEAKNLQPGVERLNPVHRYNSDEFYRTAPNWSEFEARFR